MTIKLSMPPLLLGLLLLAGVDRGFGQVVILPNTRMPRDSAARAQLVASLQDFMTQIDKPNKDNSRVLSEDLLETSALLDEMKNLSGKPYLTNVVAVSSTDFLIQLAYMGVQRDTPMIRAAFTLLAGKAAAPTSTSPTSPGPPGFYFRSPLRQNTAYWKSTKIGNTTIYFKNNLNESKARIYFDSIASYDKRLNAPDMPQDFYCADNFPEALRLLGIDFKSDYNGRAHSYFTAKENNHTLNVNGSLTADFTRFDPHDLWHDRLHNVLPIDTINRPVDEGSAYLYGGSWGLSWTEILSRFKTFANANPDADWRALYNQDKNFDEKSRFPLNVDYVINALLIQKIEKEKGFAAVLELLACGKQQPGNKNYFNALQHITGITQSNFNNAVWKLIRAS